jgi:hypothetical protein
MNAIVENLKQRHDIMTWIATRIPDGHLGMRRYVAARKELTDELVRLGFSLDNGNDESLMKLADDCAGRVDGEILKNALIGDLVFYGAVIAALAGAGWLLWGDDVAQGVIASAQAVLNSIDALEGDTNQYPFENTVIQQRGRQKMYAGIRPNLEDLIQAAETFEENKEDAFLGNTQEEMVQRVSAIAARGDITRDAKRYKRLLVAAKRLIGDDNRGWINFLNAIAPKQEAPSGILEEYWGKLVGVYEKVMGNPYENIADQLENLASEIDRALEEASAFENLSRQHGRTLAEVSQRQEKRRQQPLFRPPEVRPRPAPVPAPIPAAPTPTVAPIIPLKPLTPAPQPALPVAEEPFKEFSLAAGQEQQPIEKR